MADSPPQPANTGPRSERVAMWVRRRLVWLLLSSYALAALAPGPGVWLVGWGNDSAVATVRFSLVMVGVLLACGAAAIDLRKLRELPQRPAALAIALAGVWGPPVLVVAVAGLVARAALSPHDADAVSLGLALAGAMPVANSAVGWAQQAGGSLVWGVGLVVLSICLCPWATPGLLWLMGLAQTGAAADRAESLVGQFTGVVFFVWVLGPTLLGLALRAAVGAERVAQRQAWLTLASAAALLLLNYANAASALPSLLAAPDWRLLVVAALASAALPLVGVLSGRALARLAGVSRQGRVAWGFALGMKNTGLALGLAGATFGGRPAVVLTILAVTLAQHVVAGAAHAAWGEGAIRAPAPAR